MGSAGGHQLLDDSAKRPNKGFCCFALHISCRGMQNAIQWIKIGCWEASFWNGPILHVLTLEVYINIKNLKIYRKTGSYNAIMLLPEKVAGLRLILALSGFTTSTWWSLHKPQTHSIPHKIFPKCLIRIALNCCSAHTNGHFSLRNKWKQNLSTHALLQTLENLLEGN